MAGPGGVRVTDLVFTTPTADDAATLAAFFCRCFTDTFGHLYRAEDLAAFLATQTVERWRGELADPGFSFCLVRAGAMPVAFAKLAPVALPVAPTGPALELRQFYLAAGQQGTGLAQRLMAWVIDAARTRDARELFLSVFTDNHRARRFYERIGFERVGTYAFMVGEQADEDDLMRLTL